MPVMTGAEVLQILRTGNHTDIRVIMASAGLHLERFLGEGANAVLPKPFDLDMLLATVEAVLPNA